jgi:uncharacterized membrane protein YgcG
MPVRRVLTAFLLALGIAGAPLALGASAAVAADPVDLGPGRVVDQAGVLSTADSDTIESTTADLKKNHHITLSVVFVDHFTDPADAEDWANETAARNDLGPTDYLLAIATDTGSYYLSGDDSGPVSDQELTAIEQQQVAPKVHTQDWTQAAVAAANGLGDAVGTGPGPWFVWLLVVGLIVVAAVVALLIRRQRRVRSRRSLTP